MTDPADLTALRAATVIAVLRAPSAAAAVAATDALVAGGVTGIEITYSTPDAPAAIREVRQRHGDAVYLGAGTVLTEDHATEAVAAGAEFLVSPGTDPMLTRAMISTGVTVLSGAYTPSEVMLGGESRRARGEAVPGVARRSRLAEGVARAVPRPGVLPDGWGEPRQPRRLARCRGGRRGGRWRAVSRRRAAKRRLGDDHRSRRAVRRGRSGGPSMTRSPRAGRSGHPDGLRRRQHGRVVHPYGVPALGRRPRPADPHPGRSRRAAGRVAIVVPRAGRGHRRRPAALGGAGDHPQDGGSRRGRRPVRRAGRPGDDVRRDLLHRQARGPSARQRQGPGDGPARSRGVPTRRPLRHRPGPRPWSSVPAGPGRRSASSSASAPTGRP